MWGVSQVLGWRQLASKSLALHAGGGGHMLGADIWRLRKHGVRLPQLLAGALGLGSGDAEYQLVTLAPPRLDLPNPGFLKKQTHSPREQYMQCSADQGQLCDPAPLRRQRQRHSPISGWNASAWLLKSVTPILASIGVSDSYTGEYKSITLPRPQRERTLLRWSCDWVTGHFS